MGVDATELMALVQERDAQLEKAKEVRIALDRLNKQIKKACPHAMTMRQEGWIEDEWARTTYITTWDECTICREKLNVVKETKWYPGV